MLVVLPWDWVRFGESRLRHSEELLHAGVAERCPEMRESKLWLHSVLRVKEVLVHGLVEHEVAAIHADNRFVTIP